MNLSKKTFIYSFILSGGIVTLIIIYFVVMLPSLYIDHLSKSHYQSIKKIQENYIKDKNYNNIYYCIYYIINIIILFKYISYKKGVISLETLLIIFLIGLVIYNIVYSIFFYYYSTLT